MGVFGGCAASSGDDNLRLELFRFLVQVVRGWWFMFFSFLIIAAAAATYIFSIYSKYIKTSLGYDQSTLDTLSFFKDLGANVGILSSLINGVTPSWDVLSLCAAMNLFGYLMIYLAITGWTTPSRLWPMCLYICVGANSQTFANTSNQVQVPSAVDADAGAPPLLCRPPSYCFRSPQFPLLCRRRHRLLLRRAMVVALLHHLRDLRTQVLLHVVQLRRRRRPAGVIPPQREGSRAFVRRGGKEAEDSGWRRWRRQGLDVCRCGVLQDVVPHNYDGDGGRCDGVASASVEDEGVQR